MLDTNHIKEELSYAYVHAVASRAGLGCGHVRIDRDSIDAVIRGRGKLAHDSKFWSPCLHLQLKAHAAECPIGDSFSFPLRLKNYNDLRLPSHVPRLLAVLLMPVNDAEWVSLNEDGLIARRCC